MNLDAGRACLKARQQQEAHRQEALRQQVTQAVRGSAAVILPGFPNVRRACLFGSAWSKSDA